MRPSVFMKMCPQLFAAYRCWHAAMRAASYLMYGRGDDCNVASFCHQVPPDERQVSGRPYCLSKVSTCGTCPFFYNALHLKILGRCSNGQFRSALHEQNAQEVGFCRNAEATSVWAQAELFSETGEASEFP